MTVVSLCLGLDISPKRLGWALARLEDGAPVACGCEAIELPAKGWRTLHMDGALFAAAAAEGRDGEIHYVAIELPALVAKSGPKSAFVAGRAYQAAFDAVRRRWPWAVVDEFQPSEWRRLAGLAGNAPKWTVVSRSIEAGFWDDWPGNRDSISQDACDAACIALAGVERNRQTLATPAGEAGR